MFWPATAVGGMVTVPATRSAGAGSCTCVAAAALALSLVVSLSDTA